MLKAACRKLATVTVFTITALLFISVRTHGADKSPPSWAEVQNVVTNHFATVPGRRPYDLISQQDVEPLFNELRRIGLAPADVESAADGFLPSNAVLVKALATDTGRQFMRKVSKLPEVYDRLERLTWLQGGPEMLQELIANPAGPKQVEHWTTASGAKEMATKVAKDPRGLNFALPTGHIHTAEALLEELNRNHDDAVRAQTANR